MKPTQEQILSSIQENKPKKELLSVQKIDLAKKPDAILKDAIALDNAILKSSTKIDKSYLAYTKAWQEFDTKIEGYSKKVDTLINESAKVSKAIIDLGLRPNDVPDVLEANKRTSKIAQILKDYKNLYPKI